MDKICQVTVCTGTACFVMGGAEILALEDRLPQALRGRIAIEGAPCLGLCKDRKGGNPPFVRIDGEILAEATLDRVLSRVEARLEPGLGGETAE